MSSRFHKHNDGISYFIVVFVVFMKNHEISEKKTFCRNWHGEELPHINKQMKNASRSVISFVKFLLQSCCEICISSAARMEMGLQSEVYCTSQTSKFRFGFCSNGHCESPLRWTIYRSHQQLTTYEKRFKEFSHFQFLPFFDNLDDYQDYPMKHIPYGNRTRCQRNRWEQINFKSFVN